MIKLSVCIITFNEEKNIARCIESVKDIADEIIVVDSFSTDKTKEICESYGVRFETNEFAGHIQQKNHAISRATHQHVFSIDADECPDEILLEEIKKAKANWQGDGYSHNRLNNYVGHWVRHCGWYPDKKIRLFDKDKARWGGTNPHDIIIMEDNTTVTHLKGDLLHYSYDSYEAHHIQTEKFSTIGAKALYDKGRKTNILDTTLRPFWQFFRDYVIKLGFLDGSAGLRICLINGKNVYLKYSKLRKLWQNSNS